MRNRFSLFTCTSATEISKAPFTLFSNPLLNHLILRPLLHESIELFMQRNSTAGTHPIFLINLRFWNPSLLFRGGFHPFVAAESFSAWDSCFCFEASLEFCSDCVAAAHISVVELLTHYGFLNVLYVVPWGAGSTFASLEMNLAREEGGLYTPPSREDRGESIVQILCLS